MQVVVTARKHAEKKKVSSAKSFKFELRLLGTKNEALGNQNKTLFPIT